MPFFSSVNLKKHLRQKFVKDSVWSTFSVGVVALSGLIFQSSIGNSLGAAALGLFNKSTTIYLLVVTVAGFSIPETIVRFAVLYKNDTKKLFSVFISAIIISFLLSIFLYILAMFILNKGIFESSYEFKYFILVQLLSLPLFVANRIIFSLLNGIREMKAFAILQALRWIILLLTILAYLYSFNSILALAQTFIITESILLVISTVYLIRNNIICISINRNIFKQAKELITYSANLVPGSIIYDLNSSIDIIILGLYYANSEIGIYSFSLLAVNAFLMISSIIHINFNPIIVESLNSSNPFEFKDSIFKVRNASIGIMSLIALFLCLSYPIYIKLFIKDQILYDSIAIFYLLMFGALLKSYFAFLSSVFIMSGNPRLQSLLTFIGLILRSLLLIALVPPYSVTGAAFATSIFYVLSVLIFVSVFYKKLGINLFAVK